MASEQETVGRWIFCEYLYETGFALPVQLCEACHRQLFLFYMGLEQLDALLEEPLHGCLHTLAAVTILAAANRGPAELVDQLSAEIGQHGWNRPVQPGDSEIIY